jgi:hypothetical protein
MGRPRSNNFEKNLKYRKDPASKQISDGKLEKITSLLKSIYGVAGFRSQNEVVTNYDEYQKLGADGVLIRPHWRVPFEDLRKASYGTSLIGAIHKIDVDMVAPFGKAFYTKQECEGYGFELDNENQKTEKADLRIIKDAVNFFNTMGYKTPGYSKRDKFKSVLEMMTRDVLSIDSVCFQLIRNRFGQIIEMRYLDPATIYETSQEGYRGDKSISHVQVIENDVVCTFSDEEIILRRKHASSDIYRRNTGFSPTEACILDLAGIINALKFNKDRFTSRNPPLGFWTIAADVTEDTLAELQMQFENLYSGNQNNYRFPIIGTAAGDLKYQSLNLPSDIMFQDLIQWLVQLVIAAHGVSQEELGFKLKSGQTLSEPNPDKAIKRSSQRRLKSHLSFFSDVFNEIREHNKRWTRYQFTFYGINFEDVTETLGQDKQKISTYMTIDELRISKGMKPLGESMKEIYKMTDEEYEKVKLAGNLIADNTYAQFNNKQDQGGMDMGMDDMGDDDSMPEGM